jgi:hypothetical protein
MREERMDISDEDDEKTDTPDSLSHNYTLPTSSPPPPRSRSSSSQVNPPFSTIPQTQLSEFPFFSNYDSQPFTLQILSYLNARDLCQLSLTSRSFYHATLSTKLWKNLLLIDFMFPDEEIERISRTPNNFHTASPPLIHSSSSRLASGDTLKGFYIQQMREVQIRIKSAKDLKLEIENERALERKVQSVESFLDFTSIRLCVPLPAASLFSTLLMIGLRVDGNSLPIWICLSPLLFFLLYTLFVSLLAFITFQYRHHQTPLIRSLWTNLRGPIHHIFTQALQESNTGARLSLTAWCLLLIQILFLGFKTSNSFNSSFHQTFDWGLVFLPLWLLFFLYLTLPAFGCTKGNLGPFFVIFGFFWIPFFILFVLLTVKLNGGDTHGSHRRMKISLILIPFWILEGVVMLTGLIGLVNGIHRYRKGFLDKDNLYERIGLSIFLYLTELS